MDYVRGSRTLSSKPPSRQGFSRCPAVAGLSDHIRVESDHFFRSKSANSTGTLLLLSSREPIK